jgi:dTDP-4-dehydrorhamnose 3,5-epimerase
VIFTETPLKGAFVLDIEKIEDNRGFNARAVCQREFSTHGMTSQFVQGNILYNKTKGTLRGFHFQTPPCAETKLFRCIRGAVYDVIIDMRRESPTYKKWFGVELTATNYRMLYLPGNFAQGFITLADDTELFYLVSEFYSPGHERGIRYDDPQFGVVWPAPVEVISAKDRNWPDYSENVVSSVLEGIKS